MDSEIIQYILEATESQSLIKKEKIQALWSNYGEISRCFLKGGKYPSVILKHIRLPDQSNHPKGWNTDISHQRKLKSYQVELNWYNGLGKHSGTYCKIPLIIDSKSQNGEMAMIMEDLDASGYPVRKSAVNIDEVKVCLNWLANFHSQFMQAKPRGLWETGSYWHLATRPDELKVMPDKELKKAAYEIDQKLNQAKYQTIIHGDAKLANFCFSEDGKDVAAVDFQYVGGSCGMKDVAYFLSSCLDEKELESLEEELLKYYFNQLEVTLSRNTLNIDIKELIIEWRKLYNYAWADFHRFLDGWSPGHWKIHRYSDRIKKSVLMELKNELGK